MDVGFQGYARQGTARRFIISASNPLTGAVETPDAAPTWRLYGPSGIILNGTVGNALSGAVTGASNTTPIVITSVGHGLFTGNTVTVAGVLGAVDANGTWFITRLTADTFSLNSSAAGGVYTSGGTWVTTALFLIALAIADTNLLTPGETYTIELSWSTATGGKVMSFCFGCN